MQIIVTISDKQEAFLKEEFSVDDITPLVQQAIDNLAKSVVTERFRTAKTVDEQIDEIKVAKGRMPIDIEKVL